jgi:hypothetical protein
MSYTAFVLPEAMRARLLQHFPPKFKDVICHHVTDNFGVPADYKVSNDPATVTVVGYASDTSLEAIVVTIDGSLYRKDGNRYHITLSLDKSQGRKPVESNGVIAKQGFEVIPAFELGTLARSLLN